MSAIADFRDYTISITAEARPRIRAIEALRGKPHLRRFSSGRLVTDAGLPLLHDFPMLKGWQGEFPSSGSHQDAGAHLLIDGPFTNNGLATMAGLEGVWELDLFWHVTGITSAGFAGLVHLPNLGSLGCDGKLKIVSGICPL